MTAPAFLLGLVYALLLGSLFHLWRDGGFGRLVLYLCLSVAGAAAGQWLATWRGWSLYALGPLDVGLMTAGSVLFLLVGYWLGLVEFGREA
ncbi:MAG TPA: hypothetical protein VMJ64_01500 [Anaerolineales bacterium]|nr:hypothetical protein [Anaerolineales bacterium]